MIPVSEGESAPEPALLKDRVARRSAVAFPQGA
jgi:hypothetical protein